MGILGDGKTISKNIRFFAVICQINCFKINRLFKKY